MLLNEGYSGEDRNVPKIGILVTDGQAYHQNDMYQAAKRARENGITLFAVGIGSDTGVQELKQIASSPSSNHIFFLPDFNKLLSISNSVAEGICGGNVLIFSQYLKFFL